MTTLTGKTIANSYKDLLQISNSNSGIDATKRPIEDGEGTQAPVTISSIKFNIASGALQINDADVTATAAQINSITSKIDSSEKAAANGVATLDASSKIPTAQLPNISITDTFVVASEVAMLALGAQIGDVAIRTDLNKSFILRVNDPTILANWEELLTPTDAVTSVAGKTGIVTLETNDVAESTNKNYITDADQTKLSHISVTQAVDLDTMESDIATNNAKVSNATHTGDVTGSTALTIAADAVTNAKMANMSPNSIKGNNTGSPDNPVDLTASQVRTLINVADGATANSSDATLLNRANHTGTQTLATISDAGSAASKTVGTASGNIQENGALLGNSQTVETDGTGKFITATKGTAYNKAFGTGAGDVCEGNDSRLSDSRTCDNTFDNAATAKTNLALVKGDVGLGNVENLKVNLSGTTAPVSTDDSGSGYSVGSRWFDITNDKEYVCLDATATSAVWIETTQTGGAGSTNLTFDNRTATQYEVTSSTGTNATVTGATTSLAGAMVAADKTKLDGITTGATANSSDATLLNRANHTGTQTLSTISDAGSLAAKNTVATADIDNNAVALSKLADIATDSFIGRNTAAIGDPEVLSAATARGILNVADGATANSSDATLLNRANHTGTQALNTVVNAADVTGNLGQFAATTSAQLAGVISDETGTGSVVFANSPALTGSPTAPTQSANDNSTKIATTAYTDAAVEAAVAGLWDDRGSYDASTNTYPASGGSGAAGAILKGDIWTISVAGTLGGNSVNIGDTVRALVDTPGQTASNWAIGENNIGYVPENVANKENTTIDTNTTKYPTVNLLKTGLDTKEPTISAGLSSQYWRGDKTFQTLEASALDNGTSGTGKLVLQTTPTINGATMGGALNMNSNNITNGGTAAFTTLTASATSTFSEDLIVGNNATGNQSLTIKSQGASGGSSLLYFNADGANRYTIQTGAGNGVSNTFAIYDNGLTEYILFVDEQGDLSIGGSSNSATTDASIDLAATDKAFMPNRLTTTQRDLLTASNSMTLYNGTLNKFQGRQNGSWESFITTGNTSDITSTGTVTSGTWSGSFGAVSGANLTNLTAANISAGTAGISITGNAATVTTNANLTGPITSSGNATSIASQTGTGTTFVMSTSPTLTTPNIGTATVTRLENSTSFDFKIGGTFGNVIGNISADGLYIGYGLIDSNFGYKTNGTLVLDDTTLGSGIVNSSLTSVGTLTGLTVSGNVTFNEDLTIGNNATGNQSLTIKSQGGGSGSSLLYFNAAGSNRYVIQTGAGNGASNTFAIYDFGNSEYILWVDEQGDISMGGSNSATAGASLDLAATDRAFMPNRLTTTQRNALTASNGMIIYNTTDNKFQGYENGSWVNFI